MPELTAQMTDPVCVISGPQNGQQAMIRALEHAGLRVNYIDGHGLPSYTDPVTAHKAGAPNSGHQPGTEHPTHLHFLIQSGDHEKGCSLNDKGNPVKCEHVGQTELRPNPVPAQFHGQPYEDDPSVGFLAVISGNPDLVHGVAQTEGWQLRMHVAPVLQTQVEAADDLRARVKLLEDTILRGVHIK